MSFVAQAVDEMFELPAIGRDPLLKISEPAAATGRTVAIATSRA